MRMKPETLLIAAMSVFTAAGVAAAIFTELGLGAHEVLVDPGPLEPVRVEPTLIGATPVDPGVAPRIDPATAAPSSAQTAREWFASIRGYCNPVDVETRLRWQPAPETEDGAMQEAACLALAGRIDDARSAIESLPQRRQFEAAGIVFAAGHPAADAGDELAAGPLMELVVEFWPNHYMALYHAGAAAYERGDQERANQYLASFLVEYSTNDGWRRNAEAMIEFSGG